MPFKVKVFTENVDSRIKGAVSDELGRVCKTYSSAKTPLQKARCVKNIMDVLDDKVDEQKRHAIMEACGQRCIGASTLKNALKLQAHASDLDDLLVQLNVQHIGGGHLKRKGEVIYAAYDRCYCGSVSKTKVTFSETYCHCSCGWYKHLFEILLEIQVEVELLSSIIQGDPRCEFLIHPGRGGRHPI